MTVHREPLKLKKAHSGSITFGLLGGAGDFEAWDA
jgi:hypothetical protein